MSENSNHLKNIIVDEITGESICGCCGIVIEEDKIDYDGVQLSTTQDGIKATSYKQVVDSIHDYGLGSIPDPTGKGAAKLNNTKKFHIRESPDETRKKRYFVEVNKIFLQDYYPNNVKRTTYMLIRKTINKNLLNRKTTNVYLKAIIYYAYEIEYNKQPFRIFIKKVLKPTNYKLFKRYLAELKTNVKIDIPPIEDLLKNYIDKFDKKNYVTKKTMNLAKKFVYYIYANNLANGKSPIVLIAAAIVFAGRLNPAENIITKHVGLFFNVSAPSINYTIKLSYVPIKDIIIKE